MQLLDYLIIAIYLIGMILVGVWFQKKASEGTDSFFLGNRSIPWWALGASGMSSNLDVSGTMVIVAVLYAFGASGFFIELRGGIVLILAFLITYMGKWNRRAKVMTLAEWMEFRFGSGTEGKVARMIAAGYTLLVTAAIVTYFTVGAGKFFVEYFPLPSIPRLSPEVFVAILMILLSMVYTVSSGLYGVVWTGVIQGGLIFIAIASVCAIAFMQPGLPEQFSVSVPMLDGSFQVIEKNRDSWMSILPQWNAALPQNSAYSVYSLFGITIMFYFIKVLIEGAGGTGGYMIQRFFAAKNEKEVVKLSLFWTSLLSLRWAFVAAVAVLGVTYGLQTGTVIADPEKVLPTIINVFLPTGLKGLIIAGLIAAAMSTFDSIVNAGASYWVKDIYQSTINHQATEKQLVFQSRIASIVIVVIGVFASLWVANINDIWGWLTMGLGSGMIIPLFLRWYWWRFNGYGFAAGTIVGSIAAYAAVLLLPDTTEWITFSVVSVTSLIAAVLVALLTRQTPDSVLINFYSVTKPFGIWEPIRRKSTGIDLEEVKTENKRDLVATVITIIWQLSLFITMMMLILKEWNTFIITCTICVISSIMLYRRWYRYLRVDK